MHSGLQSGQKVRSSLFQIPTKRKRKHAKRTGCGSFRLIILWLNQPSGFGIENTNHGYFDTHLLIRPTAAMRPLHTRLPAEHFEINETTKNSAKKNSKPNLNVLSRLGISFGTRTPEKREYFSNVAITICCRRHESEKVSHHEKQL